MSNPKYTKRAKKRWKTLKMMFERFYKENGRQMTYAELQKIMHGGR